MPVKGLLTLSFLAASMVLSAGAFAQDQPRGMLGDFDLKSVILSPAPLGPPSQFEPRAVAAKPDAKLAVAAKAETKPVVMKSEAAPPRRIASSKPRQKSAVAARKPKANPLDSYARDVRRQAWPCAGGGICAWTQPR